MADGPAGLDPRQFRDALGAFATGVTIITTRDAAGQPIGVTANSYNSVSLDPPLILWSLARTSRSFDAFMQAESFAVHVLCEAQEDLAMRFASRGEDKFAGLAVDNEHGGAPLLPGCSTRLECTTHARHDGGDHVIFVGEVKRFDSIRQEPLLFHHGRFARLAPVDECEEAA